MSIENAGSDQLSQSTCEAIVSCIAKAVEKEPVNQRRPLRIPGGPILGSQIVIDASSDGGLKNRCRLSVLNPELAPAGEAARIEYEHDRQGKFGVRRVYSIQSVRRRNGNLILLENFLAENPETVREADFSPIGSESYARDTILKSIEDWANYQAWQLQENSKK